MNVTQMIEVEINDGRTIGTTPFQLLQWKHALRLEAKGMTMSGGRKVSTHLRKLLGLPRTYPASNLAVWVERVLEEIGGPDESNS